MKTVWFILFTEMRKKFNNSNKINKNPSNLIENNLTTVKYYSWKLKQKKTNET